jgi:hypothetical protein
MNCEKRTFLEWLKLVESLRPFSRIDKCNFYADLHEPIIFRSKDYFEFYITSI